MKKIALCFLTIFLTACAAAPPETTAGIKGGDNAGGESPKKSIIIDETVYNLPIVMYHHVKQKNPGTYTVTPDEFEGDLVFLKEQGFTTITIAELIGFKDGTFKMPEKPVALTFDDGRYNNYSQAFPLLKKHGCKASFFVIGSFVKKFSGGRPQYEGSSFMNFDNLKEMSASGLCDIQNHAYDFHDWTNGRTGVQKKPGETFEDYKKALEADVNQTQNLLKENCGVSPDAFAYPFGAYNSDAEKIISGMGFRAILTTDWGTNKISQRGGDTLLRLKRANRDHGATSENFFKQNYQGVF